MDGGVPGLRVRVDGVGLCAVGGEGFLALLTIDGPTVPAGEPPSPPLLSVGADVVFSVRTSCLSVAQSGAVL